MHIIRSISLKTLLSIFFISLMISFGAYSFVNIFSEELLPRRTITLTVDGSEVWLFDDQSQNNLFELSIEASRNAGFEYRDASEWGYAGNMLVFYGTDEGAEFSISAAEKNNLYFMFWENKNSGNISVESGNEKHTFSLFSDVTGGEMLRVYPFQNSFFGVFLKAAIYIMLIVTVFCVLVYIYLRLKRKTVYPIKIQVNRWHFFGVWLILFIYAQIQYSHGIPNFLKFGDQSYYWSINLFAPAGNGNWAAELSAVMYSFRGYLCHLFPSLAQSIGGALGIDPARIYFLAPTGAVAWLTAYLYPALYLLVTKKNATILHVGVTLLVVLYFWNGTLTALLVDMVGAVAFLTGAVFVLKWIRNRKWWYLAMAGLAWSIACNYRTAYQYGIYVMLILLVAWWVISSGGIKTAFRKIKCDKTRVFIGMFAATICFIVIALPQYQLNRVKGHTGLLPYDYPGAWVVEGSPSDASLLESSANQSLNIGYTGYPITVSDEQMFSIKDSTFARTEFLQLPQILEAYISSPFNSLLYVVKKLILAFDLKTNITYPDEIQWASSAGIIFSLLNYFVLISAAYAFFANKRIGGLEKILGATLFFGLVIPQMIVHVEWRYFLASYLYLYYLFAYYFCELVIDKSSRKVGSYLPVLSIGIIFCFLVSFSVYY